MVKKQKLDDGTERIVETKKEARQGVEVKGMPYVLAIGTVGAAVLLAIIWYIYFVG